MILGYKSVNKTKTIQMYIDCTTIFSPLLLFSSSASTSFEISGSIRPVSERKD